MHGISKWNCYERGSIGSRVGEGVGMIVDGRRGRELTLGNGGRWRVGVAIEEGARVSFSSRQVYDVGDGKREGRMKRVRRLTLEVGRITSSRIVRSVSCSF